jgi:hypothetical protein
MRIAIQEHGRLAHLAAGIRRFTKEQEELGTSVRDVVVPMESLERADVYFFWGFRAASTLEAKTRSRGAIAVIADKGFLRRPSVMFGLNDWGAKGTYLQVPRRKADIEEWRYAEQKRALIIGQEPRDFSTLSATKNYRGWIADTKTQLESEGWEVKVREHPRNLIHAPASVPRPQPLVDDLNDTTLVVGLTSSALIEASIYGLPVVAMGEHSLANAVSTKLAEPDLTEPKGRQEYFDWMAGQCWTYAELASGSAWEAIRGQLTAESVESAGRPEGRARTARKGSQS